MPEFHAQDDGFYMNVSFWPVTDNASKASFTGNWLDAIVTDSPLSAFTGQPGFNFVGTPWLRAVRITQVSATNQMTMRILPGSFAANGIQVHPDDPLFIRVGMRCITTNAEEVQEEFVVNTTSPNVFYQDTFRGLLMKVNGVATQWRRGAVGGSSEYVSGGATYIVNTLSVDLAITDDSGFSITLGPPPSYVTNYPNPVANALDYNTRSLFINRLAEL